MALRFEAVPCFPFSVSNGCFTRAVPAAILALTLESRLVASGGQKCGARGEGEELVM